MVSKNQLRRKAYQNMRDFEIGQSEAEIVQQDGMVMAQTPQSASLLFPARLGNMKPLLEKAHKAGVGIRAWCIWEPSLPPHHNLKAWGFRYEFCGLWLVSDLIAIPEVPSVPGLEISLLERVEQITGEHPWYGDLTDSLKMEIYRTRAERSFLAPKRSVQLVGFLEGKAVGSVTLYFGRGCAGLYNVGTLTSARHKGIGRAMVNAACQYAKRAGYAWATLQCAVGLQKFYAQNGFRCVGYSQAWSTGQWQGVFHHAPKNFVLPASPPPTFPEDFLLAIQTGEEAFALRLLKQYPQLATVVFENHLEATALHWAAFDGRVAVVEELLRLGADHTIKDSTFHATPEGWAKQGGHLALAEHLHKQSFVSYIEPSPN